MSRTLFIPLALMCGFSAVSAFAEVKVVDEIVCKVSGDIVTRTDLERDKLIATEELKKQGLSGARLAEALQIRTKDSLRNRIDTLLLVARGKELNLNVDSDVNKQLADIQRRAVAAGQKELVDPDKFQQFVREQTGQSYEDYKNDLKNSILTQRVVRDEVSSKMKVKHEDLEAYYNAHQNEFQRDERIFLREIMVAANPDNIAAAERKAKTLVTRARAGEKFPELAQTNSDAASAQYGGFLDPYTKGTLREDLEAAVWNQPKGYVSDPIKIQGGYLILKVDDHQKAGLASLDEVENEVTDKIAGPRMEPMLREYLTKLRQDAFLEIKPDYIDTGAAPGKDTKWNDPAQLKPETTTKQEVLAKGRKKHVLGLPVPGTHSDSPGQSSSR
jgi:parvulin-like peptidyl-prolyl isomerase